MIMKAKNFQLILQIGTILSFFTLFLFTSDLLFPYITGRQLVFNVLVEMMLPFYVILIWRYRQYRPKKNLVGIALLSYLFVILVSCFFSVDFNLSFWGDAERMLGWFHLSHYFVFFFYLLSAWRSSKDWYNLLAFFVVLGVILSLVYLGGDNRIGNTAYLSGYLLFNLFLALILFVKTKTYFRFIWLLSLVPIFLALYQARTSGAFFGLAFAIALLLILLGVLMERKTYRLWTLGALVVFVVVILGVFSQRNTDWFQSHRLLSGLTFEKNTFQTRLVSWEGAAKEIPNNLLLGVGYGNYAHIFDKQFNSRFLDYARTETYFDRAHNNLIDITATTGVLGLITYLSIFIALFYYLWHLLKKRGFRIKNNENVNYSVKEILLIVALLMAYFVQNLAIFDTQSTYLSLMLVLAYIVFLAESELIVNDEGVKESYFYKPLTSAMKFVFIALTVFSLFLISINYRTAGLFASSVEAYSTVVRTEVSLGMEKYREALKINSPIKRDARSMMINHFNKNKDLFSDLPTDEMVENVNYIISLAYENVLYNPLNAKTNLHLSQVLETASRLFVSEEESEELLLQSLEAIKRSIKSSPERAPLYLSKAQVYLSLEDYDAVEENIKMAISLNENIPDGYCLLSQIYLALDNKEDAYSYLNECIKRDGLDNISLDSLLIQGLQRYQENENYDKSLLILDRLEDLKPDDPAVYFELMKLNLYIDDKEESIIASEKLVELVEGIEEASSIYIQIANEELASDRVEHAITAVETAAIIDPSLESDLEDFISELKKEGMIEEN